MCVSTGKISMKSTFLNLRKVQIIQCRHQWTKTKYQFSQDCWLFWEKFKSNVAINGSKTKYQLCSTICTFQENLKINVVINGGKTKYQCSEQFLHLAKPNINVVIFFLTFLRKVQKQCRHQWKQKYQCSEHFSTSSSKFQS
jgi:hypothetical protein